MRMLVSLSLCLLLGSLVSTVSTYDQGISTADYAVALSSTWSNIQVNKGNRLQERGLDVIKPSRKPILIKKGKVKIDKRDAFKADPTKLQRREPRKYGLPRHKLNPRDGLNIQRRGFEELFEGSERMVHDALKNTHKITRGAISIPKDFLGGSLHK